MGWLRINSEREDHPGKTSKELGEIREAQKAKETLHAEKLIAEREASEKAWKQECQQREVYQEAHKEEIAKEKLAQWTTRLADKVEVAKNGDMMHDPKDPPTSEELAEDIEYLTSRYSVEAFQSALAATGWTNLSDDWEIREALIMVQLIIENS